MKVITVYPNFANQGGAQDIALTLAEQLNAERPVVLTLTPLASICSAYRDRPVTFARFTLRNLWRYRRGVFLSHARLLTTMLCLLNIPLCRRLHVVHVVHNVFQEKRCLTLFPRHIVAVSQGVCDNLVDYFHLPRERVTVIENGLPDRTPAAKSPLPRDSSSVRILLMGRLCSVKRQVWLVKQLRGRMPVHVQLCFAGSGEDREALQAAIAGDSAFAYLGQIDVAKRLCEFDYVCLFSEKEGFSLALIEGAMFGKPLITNDLPVFRSINLNGETGFVFPDVEALAAALPTLPAPADEAYRRMSAAARRHYEAHFTQARMLADYRALLHRAFPHC